MQLKTHQEYNESCRLWKDPSMSNHYHFTFISKVFNITLHKYLANLITNLNFECIYLVYFVCIHLVYFDDAKY